MMSSSAVEVYSTEGISAPQKAYYWSKWASSSITNVSVSVKNKRDFNASLTCFHLADLSISRSVTTDSHVVHDPKELSYPEERVYILHLQLAGTSQNYQDGKAVFLDRGDFTLRDSARKYVLDISGPADSLVLRIPYELLASKVSNLEQLTCLRMCGDDSVNALLASSLKQLSTSYDIEDERTAQRLQKIIIDLIATAYQKYHAVEADGSCISSSNRLQVIEFIDNNLSNPHLNGEMISEGTRFSIRYLHKLFEGQPESLGRFILSRRLEECANSLKDEMMSGYSISDIGFRWGFNSSTYFGRTFKEKYGVTPREYRTENGKDES